MPITRNPWDEPLGKDERTAEQMFRDEQTKALVLYLCSDLSGNMTAGLARLQIEIAKATGLKFP